jgi:hypothetical protein
VSSKTSESADRDAHSYAPWPDQATGSCRLNLTFKVKHRVSGGSGAAAGLPACLLSPLWHLLRASLQRTHGLPSPTLHTHLRDQLRYLGMSRQASSATSFVIRPPLLQVRCRPARGTMTLTPPMWPSQRASPYLFAHVALTHFHRHSVALAGILTSRKPLSDTENLPLMVQAALIPLASPSFSCLADLYGSGNLRSLSSYSTTHSVYSTNLVVRSQKKTVRHLWR